MNCSSSRAFRRWCAATILLVLSWSLPASVEARVSPMEIVKQQLRRPNFLIMVESPESMQGLPGENPARYNEVGADCEKGDRYCRLYGQPNRCEFSGMGGQGYKFDFVSAGTASQTQTQSQTLVTSTVTFTQTGTAILTDRITMVVTSTSTTPGASTVSSTAFATLTTSQTGTGTETRTPTVSQTGTSTNTGTATPTRSQSAATTNTGTTTNTQSQSVATTNTGTSGTTQSQSGTSTNTGTMTNTQSQSAATTNTGTITNTQSLSATTTNTGTTTNIASRSVTTTNTGTITNTESRSVTSTNTGSVTTTNTYTTTNTTTEPYQGSASGGLNYWSLNDTSYVDGNGGRNGTRYGTGVTTSTSIWAGAAKFSNSTSDSYIQLPGAFSTPAFGAASAGFSVAAFIYPNSPSNTQAFIAYDGNRTNTTNTTTSTSTSTYGGFRLMTSPTSNYGNQLCVDDNSGNRWLCSGNVNAGWTLVAVTIDKASKKWIIYQYNLNGDGSCPGSVSSASSTSISTSVLATTGTWRFGASGTDHKVGLNGMLDEVQFWNTALTSTQVADLCTYVKVWLGRQTATAALTATKSYNLTSTVTGLQSYNATATVTGSSSVNATGTITGSVSANATGTVTASRTVNATGTLTASQSTNATGTLTGTQSAYSTATVLGTSTTYSTGPTSQAATATGTSSQSATVPSIVTFTDLGATETLLGTGTLTGTATTMSALKPVPDLTSCSDPGAFNCTWVGGVTRSYCYLNSSLECSSNDDCYNVTKGDFCRYIDTADGSRRGRNDFCASGTTRTCRYQAETPCNSDSQCDSGKGDYCVDGRPVNMCLKTGLWCTDDGLGCDTINGDACMPATSRMMMVKNAVRRVVLEHAYDDTAVVKIGHMHTYQAGNGNSENLFPYVKLDSTSTGTSFRTSTRVDTKFLPRSELIKGVDTLGKPCFSESAGPSNSCTIDYSGGAVALTPAVTYTLLSPGNNSRYAVPTGDGKTYTREDAPWSSTCQATCAVTAGTGAYEGSYYTFSYTFGVPVVGSPGDAAGTGSLYAPTYSPVYLGKSYGSAGNYWYLMDAERTELLNENKYGAREFSGLSSGGAGLPWSQGYVPDGSEYSLPLTGASGNATSTSAVCGETNGAQWDFKVVPMVNDTSFGGNSSLKPTQKALLNAARLDKASYGGFYANGNLEPIACALKDDNKNDKYHSIDNYMSIVQGSDTINNGGSSPCWENHVLMVVDGLPRGPGDVAVGGVDCSADACMYDPVNNPNLNGCVCPAVTKARALAANGVNVHVIAATTDLTGRNLYAAATLNNVARAGSTSPSFINIPRYAASEDELYYWLNYEMKEALRVTVATTPASSANNASGATEGSMLFQTTAELPEWRGSLVGFSIATATTTTTTTATASVYTTQLAWDAARVNAFTVRPGSSPSSEEQSLWKQRQVFYSDAGGHVRQIAVGDDGTIDNGSKTALKTLGMGGSTTETERIVQWMLGKIDPSDPDHKPLNPAVMGSVLNSMPIDVGPPGMSPLPGGNHFHYAHENRTELVYLGADDGMLHAFYAGNGKEAFAFIPADMVPVIAKIYAQGGQRYSPNQHIYGLSGSPKVKNLCVANCVVGTGLTCSDQPSGTYQGGCPDWRTILVTGEGPGGNHPFALDITSPVESGSATLGDASLLWHVGYKNASGIAASNLGETVSTPAFAYHRTSSATDNRVLLASGYPLSGTGTTTKLIDAMVWDGSTPSTAGPGATISGSGNCDASTGQEYAMLADVAVARDNLHVGSTSLVDQNLVGAYLADTWGTVHQYAPSFSPALDKGGAPIALGCHQPLHFSPAVVQLNRNNPNNPDNSVYLAQVTNSILDPVTVGASFPASMLVIGKLTSIGNVPPALAESFGTSGLIKLAADTSQGASNRLCGVTTVGKTSSAADCGSGGSWLPATARPTGTPVAVVRTDGTGFQLYTTWYDPPKANWDTCPESATSGNSYVTLHEFLSNGTWVQIVGREFPHQYVTGVQFVGTTLFITFGTNSTTPDPTTNNFGQSIQAITAQSLSALAGDRYIKTAWSERMDVE